MAELLKNSVDITKEAAKKCDLTLSGVDKSKETFLAFETLIAVTEIIYPAVLSSMISNPKESTLASIEKKLDEINEKMDILLDVHLKSAKSFLKSAIIALKYQNYDDSYDEFKKVKDSATFAFNSAKGNDIKRIKSSNMKIFSIVMTKVYKSFWYLLVQK